MKLMRVLRISRPRFWIYELGPYMIGILGGLISINDFRTSISQSGNVIHSWGPVVVALPRILIFACYFLIPANIWIYGINDIYDYETDKLNPKKMEGYEALVHPKEQPALWRWIIWSTLPFFLALQYLNCNPFAIGRCTPNLMNHITRPTIIAFLAFLFFAGQYSAKPIRAKGRPGRDSFFSAGHYIATAAFGFFLVNPLGHINRAYIIAGIARAMAMHAFSAVPDIQADSDAHVDTIATRLGGNTTIGLCFMLYALAAILSWAFLGWWAIVLGAAYCGLMLLAIDHLKRGKLFVLYTRFPWINTISGMIIFLSVLLRMIS